MISNGCDIDEFFHEINGRNHLEAILLAHQEATAVERRLLRKKMSENEETQSNSICSQYSKFLKDFIRYVRYSTRPKISDSGKYQLFQSYLESIQVKKEK